MPTIFILDDDENLLNALIMLLSDRKYEVATFTRSKDLFNAVSLFKPDIILLDVRLSEEDDGKSVCTKLKKEYKYPNKIYLFSASPVSEAEMQKCGADGFIE